ncbi:alpha-1,2-fucosyltransferase [Chitinophaga rhizosphaerae]|uniref:alpha-1,2-fucosyltransferase n=1 Tax=Chitinophaga rhizosphaerae TaxID=1864947 RepID=UPI000F802EE2|nr:alpha-1,2-fucosyltransferase [Chitinophaga rhizosphaerae]
MILVQLKGGLGNQMFQYAAGRTLALRYDVPLYLDKGSYEPRQAAMYGLDGLKIHAAAASENMIPHPGLLGKVFNRLAPASMRSILREAHFHYDPAFEAVKPPVYLKGYWQSWKYFAPVADVIREDFAFNIDFSPEILAKAEALRNSNSVAMHFRRGDYTSTSAAVYHGICEPEYYERAAARYPGATFYIFTNDPAWVKDNLPAGIPYEILSGSLSSSQYEDLFLMSQCRHQVIANSSYSWWAAWLNRFPGKRITAPKRWFLAEGLHDHDLVPAAWDRI